MPTVKSPTKAARNANITEMIHSGMPPRQAVAAGYAIQRRAAARKGGRAAARSRTTSKGRGSKGRGSRGR